MIIHFRIQFCWSLVSMFCGVSVYSFDGIVVFGLLLVCTCAYMSRVPRLKQWLLSEKKGFFGIFYKGLQFNLIACIRTID